MWTQGSPLPLSVVSAAAAANTGMLASAKIYVIGGTADGYNAVNTIQIYYPQSDIWAEGFSMPTSRLGLGVAVLNDTFFAIGGASAAGIENNVGTVYAVNEQYLPLGYQGPMPSPFIIPNITATPSIPEVSLLIILPLMLIIAALIILKTKERLVKKDASEVNII